MLTIDVAGTESKVCEIIAIRQKTGVAKYSDMLPWMDLMAGVRDALKSQQ